MSRDLPNAVLEWGPTHATVLDLGTRARRSGSEIGEAAQVLNGQRDVVAAVSRRAAFIRALRVPDVPREEVAQILRMQLTGLFPVPEAELAYDFRLTDDVDPEGRLAVVGAMRESDLLRLHAEARANGMKIRRVLPAAFGSMVVARNLNQPNCAVVQQTNEGIAIDIIAEGELRYTRLTPATNDPDVIEGEIQRTFAAAGVEPGPVVAAEGLHLPGAIDARTTTLEALGTSGAESIHLNLEPAEVMAAREKKKHSARVRLAGLFWIAALLLATPIYLDRTDQQDKVDVQNKKNTSALAEARKLRDGEMKKSADTARLDTALTQAFQPGQTLGDVLDIVANDAPKGVWLTGVSLERGKGATFRGTSMTNQAVSDYLNKLTGEQDATGQKRFRDVKLVSTANGTLETKTVVQFSISLFPIGNLPVLEDKKGGKK